MKRIKTVITIVLLAVLTGLFSTMAEAYARTDISLKKTTKIIFCGGCRGKRSDGRKASYSKLINAKNLLDGFNPDKMKLTLKSADKSVATVSNKKLRIYAKGIGSTDIEMKVTSKKTGKVLFDKPFKVQVWKNADEDSLTILGAEDGDVFRPGDSVKIQLPAFVETTEGKIRTDTDLRRLVCDSDEVYVEKGKEENSFIVRFDEPGEYILRAEAYQSKKYSGTTVLKEIHVSVEEQESTLWQTSLNSFCYEGEAAYEDLEPSEIGIYEVFMDVECFYTNVSDINIEDGTACISVFKPFEGGSEYIIRIADEKFRFRAAEGGVGQVASMEIELPVVEAGKLAEIGYRYLNPDGIDITDSVAQVLQDYISVQITGDAEGVFVSSNRLYAPKAGASLTVKAEAVFEGLKNGRLEAQKNVITKGIEKPEYTGEYMYTFTKDDGKYLALGEEEKHYIAFGDSVVFEALLKFSDGKYRTLKEAGIDSLRIEEEYVAMQTGRLYGAASGGTQIGVNNEGATIILAMKGEEIVERFRLDVKEARKPASIEASVSKDKLNSNAFADDYIIIKADLLDQYGDVMKADGFTAVQDEENRASAGTVDFGGFTDGRMILYGSSCHMTGKDTMVKAAVKWQDFSKNISFNVKDADFNPDLIQAYDFRLKTEDVPVLDTALYGDAEAKSIFMCVELSRDGYFVGEASDFGYDIRILTEEPSMGMSAGEYRLDVGEAMFAVLVRFTPEGSRESRLLGESDCIYVGYDGAEFISFAPGAMLESGKYEVALYYIWGGEEISRLEYRGNDFSFRVIDSTPDIVYDQIAESAKIEEGAPWTKNIKKFFKFYLDGEDITGYVTKVDCSESKSGSVYVRTVSFGLENPEYGEFTKTCDVDVLIAKQ